MPDVVKDVVPAEVDAPNIEATTRPDPVIDDFIGYLPEVISETKAGYRTTEFWTTVITSLAAISGAVPMPKDTGGLAAAVMVGLYAISRGIAKKGVAHVEPPVV